jgi:alpha-N-arabinofuranosidase
LLDKQLIVTVTNPELAQTRETEIAVRGAAIKSVETTTLTAADIHAHNSFDNPRQIEPANGQVTPKSGGPFVHNFAPASVTRLRITLA